MEIGISIGIESSNQRATSPFPGDGDITDLNITNLVTRVNMKNVDVTFSKPMIYDEKRTYDLKKITIKIPHDYYTYTGLATNFFHVSPSPAFGIGYTFFPINNFRLGVRYAVGVQNYKLEVVHDESNLQNGNKGSLGLQRYCITSENFKYSNLHQNIGIVYRTNRDHRFSFYLIHKNVWIDGQANESDKFFKGYGFTYTFPIIRKNIEKLKE
ncbi:hypothetical protein [Saccharicrinis sp. FJH54]|uniref:hypothetical protein n=1 Tax=Saccharicrinis sp. FJH54 TaxID=3344665 RepID=UPI0035D44FF6